MTKEPVQVMQVSDNLYVADMGNDNLLQVEMTGLVNRDGKVLKSYSVTSSNNKINGHFEHAPDGTPIHFIQQMVNFFLVQEDIKRNWFR